MVSCHGIKSAYQIYFCRYLNEIYLCSMGRSQKNTNDIEWYQTTTFKKET